MTQRTDQWLRDRLGFVTASRFSDVMGSPAAWRTYAREIREGLELRKRIEAGEDVELPPSFSNAAMEHGNTWEDVARAEYEMLRDVDMSVPDFIVHPSIPFVGCSADGLTPSSAPVGGVELKCPFNQNVHAQTAVRREMPAEHRPQVQGVIWVCGLDWLDFISFDPRRDDKDRLIILRQERDDKYIELLEERVPRFWQFVQSGSNDPTEFYAESNRAIPQLF